MAELRLNRRVRQAPIVPERSVSGRTLMLLIAIMTFLCSVTLGGVVLVQKSAVAWSADVGREVTIEIRPTPGEVMDSNLRTAVSLAEATPGVASARALTLKESEDLLKPWLGDNVDFSGLDIPRLVVVKLSDPANADLGKLAKDISGIPGASLQTHSAWRQELNAMAGTIVVAGLLVLGLIGVATVLAVVFATRGTMASNREIVDVLHFIGASNDFIAGEFQGRFLMLGFRGGLAGGVAAIVFFILAGMATGNVTSGATSAQIDVMFGQFVLGFDGVLGIAVVIPVIAGLTAVTSRMTVRRFLSQLSS